jgi:hypothetical protein
MPGEANRRLPRRKRRGVYNRGNAADHGRPPLPHTRSESYSHPAVRRAVAARWVHEIAKHRLTYLPAAELARIRTTGKYRLWRESTHRAGRGWSHLQFGPMVCSRRPCQSTTAPAGPEISNPCGIRDSTSRRATCCARPISFSELQHMRTYGP